jgi:hypothetical protein
MSYTSFDQITQADVNQMGQAFIRRQGEIPGVIREMLRQLADLDEGSPVNSNTACRRRPEPFATELPKRW